MVTCPQVPQLGILRIRLASTHGAQRSEGARQKLAHVRRVDTTASPQSRRMSTVAHEAKYTLPKDPNDSGAIPHGYHVTRQALLVM